MRSERSWGRLGMRYNVIQVQLKNLLAEPTRNGLTKPKAIRGNGVPMIAMGEVFANNRIFSFPMERVPVTDKELSSSSIHEGDLLFARQSLVLEGAGKCCIVKEVNEPTVFESHLIRVRLDNSKALADYIYYYFKSFQGKENIMTIVEQVAAAGIRGSDLVNLYIPVPPITVQQQIVQVLMNIDDKIAVNTAINENLEQQAQAIFKSWFVDFEPFGGVMPDDWNTSNLGSFVTIKRGGSPRPIQNYLSETGYRWLKISDVTSLNSPFILDIKEHIIESGLKKTVLLKQGALVLSNSATPGIPKILDVDSCIHDGWLYFPESKLSNEYLYLLFKFIRKDLVALGNGSVFTNLKTDILKQYEISLPSERVLNDFQTVISPLFEAMRNIARENKSLAALRDTLLPKLMNGEIDVSNVRI